MSSIRMRALMSGMLFGIGACLTAPAALAQDTTFEWSEYPLDAATLVISEDRELFALDEEGRSFRQTLKPRLRWISLREDFESIFAHHANDEVWALKAGSGRPYRYNGSFWAEKGRVDIRDLAIDAQGRVFGVTENQEILWWREDRTRWARVAENIGSPVVQIVAGLNREFFLLSEAGDVLEVSSDGVIRSAGLGNVARLGFDEFLNTLLVIDREGETFRWNAASSEQVEIDVPTEVVSITSDVDGTLWIVGEDGEIFSGREQFLDDAVEDVSDLPLVSAEDGPPVVPTEEEDEENSDEQVADAAEGAAVEEQVPAEPQFRFQFFRIPDVEAARLAIGDDGRVFALSSAAGYSMWNNGRRNFHDFPGTAARAAVGPDDEIWGVNNSGDVSFFDGTQWRGIDYSEARDIWVSPEGAVWISTLDDEIRVYDRRRKQFKRTKLEGTTVTFDSQGRFWTVTEDGGIRRCAGSRCELIPGDATDIIAGRQDFVLRVNEDGNLYLFNEQRTNWILLRSAVRTVELGPGDQPWIVESDGGILASALFERDEKDDFIVAERAAQIEERNARFATSSTNTTSSGFTFTKNISFDEVPLNGGSVGARIMFVGPNDAAFVLGTDFATVWEYDADDDEFDLFTDLPLATGTTIRRMAVDENGRPWVVYASNRIFRPEGTKRYEEITGFSASFVDANYNSIVMAVDTSNQLHTYDANKDEFELLDDGVGVDAGDFSLDPDGNPWIRLNTAGTLQQYDGKRFEDRPDNAPQDIDNIGIGGNGDIYVSEQLGVSERLLKWNESNENFDEVDTPSNASVLWVDVGGDGRPWFVSTDNKVYRAE